MEFYLVDEVVIFSDLSPLPEPQENKISEMKGIAFLFSCHNFPIILYRRFGTWPVAMLAQTWNKVELEGPVCNGSQVIGWHTNKSKGLRRFHIDMSGFAFNSTILWDPKRWQRPTSDPIRQLDTVKEGFHVWIMSLQYKLSIYVWHPYFVELMGSQNQSRRPKLSFHCVFLQGTTFIEQVVEDESQMEGLPLGCSKILNWHLKLEARELFNPKASLLQKNLDV